MQVKNQYVKEMRADSRFAKKKYLALNSNEHKLKKYFLKTFSVCVFCSKTIFIVPVYFLVFLVKVM